jgi:hypothetical protein
LNDPLNYPLVKVDGEYIYALNNNYSIMKWSRITGKLIETIDKSPNFIGY